jgi:hypothetical protein
MKLNKKLVAVTGTAALVAGLGLGLTACGGGSSGYNNTSTLQTALTQAASWPSGDANIPTSAICVHQEGTQYNCTVTYSGGSESGYVVTVASDGQSFVSNPS